MAKRPNLVNPLTTAR